MARHHSCCTRINQASVTGEPLFEAGTVNCMALDEIVSEKMRAAALRKDIALVISMTLILFCATNLIRQTGR